MVILLRFAKSALIVDCDTLFMPAVYWHHIDYLDSGFARSPRALQPSLSGKLKGAWNLFGMRSIDTLMKKTVPVWWYENKKKKIFANADKVLQSDGLIPG